MLIDLQNAQADVVAKNRQIGQLKAEVSKQRGDAPESIEVKRLLEFWRRECKGGNSRIKLPLDGARARAVKRMLDAKYTPARIEQAILGAKAKPFVGPRGRQAGPGGGARRFDDIELICRDEKHLEDFERLAPDGPVHDMLDEERIALVWQIETRSISLPELCDALDVGYGELLSIWQDNRRAA